ncbi:hypothetical protein YTPLAS18_02710 [Nitrospira sp.]|nr:hypothetical protein YTPLAS18_02710 [Nitrospira sp.]
MDLVRTQSSLRVLILTIFAVLGQLGSAQADWKWVYEGMAEDGQIVLGFRAGPSYMTQNAGTSTSGPLLNWHAMYAINKWFRTGMMLEWESHSFDQRGRGSLDTVSLLPAMLEFRPGHFGPLIPYVSTGIGVNINDSNVSDSFAWRMAGGLDYALTNWFPNAPPGLMLNTEAAWKRNRIDRVDYSTLSLIFGIRFAFQ